MSHQLKSRWRGASAAAGFTIVELLIACVICAIIVTIGAGLYLGFRTRATETTAKANVRAILPAIESHFADNGTYAGMTPAGLTSTYDGGLSPASYAIPTATRDTYCVQSTVAGETWRKNGPDDPFEKQRCAAAGEGFG